MLNFKKILSLEERIVLDASIIYVDVTDAPGGNGSNWAQAYNNLDSALAKASITSGSDQIWIADGVYKPSQIYSPNGIVGGALGLNDAHLKTFNLPSNVTLYGGFKGNESNLSQRNPLVFQTVLSGDLLGNDVNDRNNANYSASKSDNVWHVVTAGNDIALTGVVAKLDGISIVNGYAFGSGNLHDQGGALLARFGSNIVLNSMLFRDNASNYTGGAIQIEGLGSVLTLTNSLLTKNAELSPIIDALHGGGALGASLGTLVNISKTIFSDNFSGEDGGAIRLGSASANISDTIFLNNEVMASGGAFASLDLFSIGLPTTINMDRVLFLNNQAVFFGGAMFFVDILGDPSSSVHIKNSEFIGNEGALLGGGLYTGNRNTVVEDTNFIGNTSHTTGGAISIDSSFDATFGLPLTIVNVKNVNFINNTVIGDEPGGLDITGFFPGTTFVSGVQGGGAIFHVSESTLIVDQSTFINNKVLNGDGGALLVGGLVILNPDNSIFNPGAKTTITNSIFTNNKALNGNGGAIAGESVVPYATLNAPTMTLSGSTFKNNDASSKGGALYLVDYTATINGNTFYKSDAQLGDQVYAKDSLLNGVDSGTPGAKLALTSVNVFKLLDNDDLILI